MDKNWFISVDGQTYGPYTWDQMSEMTLTRQLVPTSLVYHASTGKWINASQVKELWPTNVVNQTISPVQQPQQIIHQKPKKKRGCLISFLIILSIIILGILLVGLFLVKPLLSDEKMDLGKNVKVVSEAIDMDGGQVIVIDHKSEIDGLIIDVPKGAYKDVEFEVSTKSIKEHDFGDYVNPITPLIVIKNGGGYSEKMMTVTIPIDIEDDEFAMAFYYTEENELEALPLVDFSKDEITVATRHFSGLLVSSIKKSVLEEIEYDTEFRPGTDDWSFDNNGSQISPSGFCLGAAASMAYYYYEHGRYGELPLSELSDNNHGALTPEFQYDDSMGIRIASTIQYEYETSSSSLYSELNYTFIHKGKVLEDEFIHMAIGYAMIVTEEPQIVGIFVRKDEASGPTTSYGHAIVAYAITEEGIYIADPNRSGNQDMFIPYNNNKFGIYNSSTSALTSTRDYNSFSLLAKTAVVDWSRIGELFKEAELPPDEAEIGDEYFATTTLKVLMPLETGYDWVLNPSIVEIDPEDAAGLKLTVKANIEYLNDHAGRNIQIPSDFDKKAYTLLSLFTGVTPGGIEVYKGLSNKPFYDSQCVTGKYNFVLVPLENGVNNFGIYYTKERVVTNSYNYDFIDFIRIPIFYGEEDLTGTWNGSFTITNYDGALDYATDLAYKITEGLITIFAGVINPDLTDAEIDDIVESSIEVNEDIDKPMPIQVIISNKNGDRYDVNVTIETDNIYTYETEAIFEDGELTFDFIFDDGSVWHYTYGLSNNTDLVGEFTVQTGSEKNFITGISNLVKQEQ